MSTFEIIAAVFLSVFATVPFLRIFPRIVTAWWDFITALAGDGMEDTEHDNG